MSARPIKRTVVAIILIFLIGWFLYADTLRVPFIFDDKPNITENPYIRVTAITPDQIARITNSPAPRPFANLSFALNHYFYQYHVTGYHLINILIHIITAVLISFITNATLRLCRKASVSPTTPAALFAAIIWLIHPLHTQSVTYIVQRMNSLAAMFSLFGLLCYIKARLAFKAPGQKIKKSLLVTGVIVAGALGLASKENAAILPATLLLYEWFFFQDLRPDWIKKQAWWLVVVGVSMITAAIIYMGASPMAFLLNMYEAQPFTMPQRLLTEPLVILYYLSLLFYPHPARLTLDYHFPISESLWMPAITVLALTALFLMIIGAIVTARKYRLVSFAILWFLMTLAIESSFIGLALIFEHRTYLPSVFPVIAVVILLTNCLKSRPATAACLLTSIIILLLTWTYQRNSVWQNEKVFWNDCLAKNPNSARLYNNLGIVLLQHNQPERAIRRFKEAITIDPAYYKAYNNIGITLYQQHHPAQAISWYQRALAIHPSFAEAASNLGTALLSLGKAGKACPYFKQAIRMDPGYAMAHNNSGLCLARQGQTTAAINAYRHVLKLDPALPEAHFNLGEALLASGDITTALAHLKKAHQLTPDDPSRLHKLAEAFYQNKNYRAAAKYMALLQQLQPDSPKILFNLACLYARLGQRQKALEYLAEAIKQGYNDWQQIKVDPDLESLRETPYYRNLIKLSEVQP